jgi:hypothetical protein
MKIRLILTMIVLAALTRLGLNLLPAPPHNFSPIAAMGLFGAAYFNRRWMALAVPFAALFLSDLFINNVIYKAYFPEFTLITSVWVYGAFAAVMAAGWLMLRSKVSTYRVVATSLTASMVFFLVSNFGVFIQSGMYPKNGAGLLACYTAGLPFLGNTLLGDLFFTVAMFGTYEWVTRRVPAFQRA